MDTGSAEPVGAEQVGIADALFTTTQQRVLRFLFGQPSRSFFASELIRLTGSGSGAVQRELHRLASSGLVTVTWIGNQKHYQANADSPVFNELCILVRRTVAISDPIRAALAPLAENISLALIFGSVAKGVDSADSDIDLLVVADNLSLESLYSVLNRAETTLDRRIGPTLYTNEEYQSRLASGNPFLNRVLESEFQVLIGNPDDASKARQPGKNRSAES